MADEKLKALEDEFQEAKNDMKQIMLDIRAILMEASSPLRWEGNGDINSVQNSSEKGQI